MLEKNKSTTSKFRMLVEKALKEDGLPRDYDYWRTTDPSYENDDDDDYQDWLDDRDYISKYAVFVNTSEKYGNEYAEFDDSEEPGSWETTNELISSQDFRNVWNTEEEAANVAKEYKAQHPESNPSVVTVYAKDEFSPFYEKLSDVYPYDEYEQDKEDEMYNYWED